MKIWMEEKTYGGRKAIRFRAKIIKSVKHGIPSTVQKTWRAFTESSVYDGSDIKKMFMAQARRWQHSMMLKWFGSPEKFPTQIEIPHECNEASNQGQPVSGVQEAGLVSGGEVVGPVHESPVPAPEDNGGRERGVSPPT